ncbi:MAG: glycine/betaine ABC transporter substrate-binding protein, partial [Leucobacter sp.]|nr:glycine/betaine ABC transporter substrate-binding protein [Leucobacter sp.]
MKKSKLTAALALGAAASLVLAGCSGSGSDSGDSGDTGGSTAGDTITLGFIPSWTDGLSTAYLLANQLEQLGYEVEMEE